MSLSEEAIREFKEIYKKDTGKELSDQEALDMATNLLTLFDAIYRPIPKEHEKEFKRICREQREYSKKVKDLAAERLAKIFVRQMDARRKKGNKNLKKTEKKPTFLVIPVPAEQIGKNLKLQ